MRNVTFSFALIPVISILFATANKAYAQKLLDASGPINVVLSSSGGSNATVSLAYSVRQLKTTYDHIAITPPAAVSGFSNSSTPLLRVKRSSDNGQLDIGYDLNGNLDTLTLKNFVSNNGVNPTANGVVTIWYDQSGNSRDAKEDALANGGTPINPFIVTAGVIERNSGGQVGINGVNGGMLSDGGDAFDVAPSGVNRYGISGDRTLNVVSQPFVYNTTGGTADGSGTYLIDRNGSYNSSGAGTQDAPLTCIKAVGNNWACQIRNDAADISSSYVGSIGISTNRSDNVTVVRSGNSYPMYVNGVLAGTATLTGVNTMTPVRIGYGSSTGEDVYYGEFLLFPSALSSTDLATLNVSQGDYFSLGSAPNTWEGSISTAWATAGNWSSATVPDALASVTIPGGTPFAPTLSTSISIKKMTINSGATLTVVTGGTLTLSDSLIVNGTLAGSGTGTVTFAGGFKQIITGTTTPIAFNNLTISNTVDTIVSNNSINVTGILTVNSGAVFSLAPAAIVNNSPTAGTITGSGTVLVTRITGTANYQNQYKFSTNTLGNLTINYAGEGAQTITIAGITHGNIAVSGSGTKTLSAAVSAINVTGSITVLGATFSNNGNAIVGNPAKSFSVLNSGTFLLAGTTSTYPTGFGTFTFNANSTVNYAGSGAQTIVAANYGNLTSSGAGARTLSGTVGIAGVFTIGSNSYTVGSSTVDYNGTDEQIIAAMTYNNLTISGVRIGSPSIILESGIINVGGTLSVTATGVGAWDSTDNTVNYSGGAQMVAAAIPYNNLTLSGSGSKTTTSVTVSGIFSLEGSATVSAAITYGSDATLQYNGRGTYTATLNEWPATFSGTGGVVLTGVNLITISAKKVITYNLSIGTGSALNLGGVTTHTADALLFAGNGQVSGTWGYSGASHNNTTYFANNAGRITIASASVTWDGSSSVNWGTGANWSTGSVPTATTNIVIPSGVPNQPTINTAAVCRDITINSGATLGYTSGSLTINGDFVNSGSTSLGGCQVTIAGTATQSIAGFTTTGTITISKASGTVTFPDITAAGSLNITGAGATLAINNAFTVTNALTFYKPANANVSVAISGTGTLTCGSVSVGENGTPPTSNTTNRTHTLTSTIASFVITGNLSINSYFANNNRIRNGVFTHTSGTVSVGGAITTSNANAANTSAYTMGNSSPVLVLTGTAPFNLSGTGTSTITLSGTGATVNYAGTAAVQAARGTTYTIFKANNTAGVTLAAAATIGTLTIGDETANSIFNDAGFAISTASTLNMVSGTYNLSGSWPGWATRNFSAGTTVAYVSESAQTISATPSYRNLTFSGAGTKNITTGTTLSVAEDWSTTNGTATFGGTAGITVAGNIGGSGAITMGSGTINLAGLWNNSGTFTPGTGTVNYNGTGAQTIGPVNYYNLTISTARLSSPPITFATGTIGIANTFSLTATGIGGYTNTGSTVNYNGTGAQSIVPINYNNLTISGARAGSPAITLASGNIGVAGIFTISATGVGNYATTGNTLDYNGPGAQTIEAFNYNNLSISGTRSGSPALTLAPGTVGIAGNFTVSATGVNNYTVTGNTVNYNGSASQTISAFDYNDLTSSSSGARILAASGTIGVAGTFTKGSNSYTVTSSTVNYSALTGGQTVTSFTYNNLTLSNTSGTNTAGGTVTVGGTLTTTSGGIFNLSTFQLTGGLTGVSNNGTIQTSATTTPVPTGKNWGGTVIYNLSTGGQPISVGTYNNLTSNNTSGTNTVSGALTVDGTLTVASAGILNMGSNQLNGGLSSVSNSGTIQTSSTSTPPLPAGKTWGGTVVYTLASGGQTIPAGTFSVLTSNNTSSTNTLSGNVSVTSILNFASSGTGKITIGSNTLTLGGSVVNATSSRCFVGSNSSSITINGSGALGGNLMLDQTIPGTTNRINNLTYNRSSQTITLNDTVEVVGIITPTAGTLATANKLKLISNSSGTALVAQGSGSYISGNVIVERYIPSVSRRWRFFGSQVSGTTFADLKNEMFITGANGATNGFDATSSNQPSIYSYDETVTTGDLNSGYAAATNITNPITVGKGYRIFVRGDRSDIGRLNGTTTTQNAVTLNVIGALNTGNITIPLTYTSSGVSANDGWNLVANPYASPIDWNAFHDAGRTGSSPNYSGTDYAHINPSIYIYNASTGSYTSFNALSGVGVGTLANGIIPSGAAFWIQATAASPTITMKENYKTSSAPAAVFKTGTEQFTIKLIENEFSSDEASFKYVADATSGFDVYDIRKLSGADVNISSIGTDGSFLSANCSPFGENRDTIPLSIDVARSGEYKLEFHNPENMTTGGAASPIYLVDLWLHKVVDVKKEMAYSFTVDKDNAATSGDRRFMLVTGDLPTDVPEVDKHFKVHEVYLYPAITNDIVTLFSSKPVDEAVEIRITDISGKTVSELKNTEWNGNQLQLNLGAYPQGLYFISIIGKDQHAQTLKCLKE